MSSYWSPEVEYTCTNDCRMEGCPGHALKLRFNCTSDTISVHVDGEMREVFDDDRFAAMLRAYDFTDPVGRAEARHRGFHNWCATEGIALTPMQREMAGIILDGVKDRPHLIPFMTATAAGRAFLMDKLWRYLDETATLPVDPSSQP